MHWGLKLEFIKSMRTKKVWVLLGIMMLLYVPGFYLEKMNGNTPQTVGEAVNMLVSNIEDLAGFFLGILALLLGATAINSDLENGTIRVALSKPVRRIGYLGGKFLAHVVVLLAALLLMTVIGIIGLAWMGAPFGQKLVTESMLLNFLLLLAMIQLVALGYILSTMIKSSGTALGAALALFFILFMLIPSIVSFMAIKDYVFDENVNYDEVAERVDEYTTKYLFYSPLSQMGVILGDVYEDGNYVGIAHAIGKNPVNFGLIVGMTIVYFGGAFLRFARMDLR
ncbi:hypothetical membrane protein, conserved [Thermococcus kodakarensis KOD1]|uniref:Hypothetical membrane protein, conserved n=1 Tax=Thermococcus kodakarensis (strain ATCC BAA-918 / JCM 12380 / KOD1) TaxID=69014 RepID=Q5JI95_THEKO|nr:ABC transporter permease subunit [Thermococcus kodakarensis]WCN28924.1 ABC transporter permease subunit [Thermococcus kodakarensis]WCN31226.1 ABC transporter permease subunit [Thermococcus kodakarensis]BAD85130.1 hypothetical membrane protein, conserved [Thermococcus kodakarensis KOD1]